VHIPVNMLETMWPMVCNSQLLKYAQTKCRKPKDSFTDEHDRRHVGREVMV